MLRILISVCVVRMYGTVQEIRVVHGSYGVLVHLVLYERHQSPAQSQPYVGNHM